MSSNRNNTSNYYTGKLFADLLSAIEYMQETDGNVMQCYFVSNGIFTNRDNAERYAKSTGVGVIKNG